MMAGLTEKNKQAIDVYLGAGSPEAKGNGTRAWQEVYGTKRENTAAMAWSRMIRNDKAQEYLKARQTEIQDAVKENIVYGVKESVADITDMKDLAARLARENEDVQAIRAAVSASTEALKVQGLYVTKSESENVNVNATAEDRMWAAAYGFGLAEYLERKAQNNLPSPPELPGAESLH